MPTVELAYERAVRSAAAGAFSGHEERFAWPLVARDRGYVVAGRHRLTSQFLVEVAGRAIGLWYNRDAAPTSDLLLEATLGVGIPF
jgi:hypothetical protein